MTINDKGHRRDPCGMLPFNDFQEETRRLTLTRCRRDDKYDPNHCKRQFGMLNVMINKAEGFPKVYKKTSDRASFAALHKST